MLGNVRKFINSKNSSKAENVSENSKDYLKEISLLYILGSINSILHHLKIPNRGIDSLLEESIAQWWNIEATETLTHLRWLNEFAKLASAHQECISEILSVGLASVGKKSKIGSSANENGENDRAVDNLILYL